MTSIRDDLELCASVLIRCFFLAVGVLVFWFVFYLLGGDLAYSIHSTMFDISRHEFAMMNYYGMAFVKVVSFLFFLIPWAAIRIVIRSP